MNSNSGKIVIRKIKDRENLLLYRKEYIFAVIHDAQPTPSRKGLREELAKLLGVEKDFIVVRRIKTDFGTNTSKIEVYVYSDKNKMLEIEPRYILKRNEIIKE